MTFEELMIKILANRMAVEEQASGRDDNVKAELREKEGEAVLFLTLMDLGWIIRKGH